MLNNLTYFCSVFVLKSKHDFENLIEVEEKIEYNSWIWHLCEYFIRTLSEYWKNLNLRTLFASYLTNQNGPHPGIKIHCHLVTKESVWSVHHWTYHCWSNVWNLLVPVAVHEFFSQTETSLSKNEICKFLNLSLSLVNSQFSTAQSRDDSFAFVTRILLANDDSTIII